VIAAEEDMMKQERIIRMAASVRARRPTDACVAVVATLTFGLKIVTSSVQVQVERRRRMRCL
jgi:hypothetical protein